GHHGGIVGHASVAFDGVGPKQEDLRDDRNLAQSSDRGRAPVCLSRWDRAQAQLGRRGAQRLAAGCDRRERGRLSGDSRQLRGGEGGQEWLERVPQASQGTRVSRAAELVEAAVEETLSYYAFPEEHWRRIRTNNPLERILREIRRRTRVVGAFPDGQSALNLA